MSSDDDFEPRLGKLRAGGGRAERPFRNQVLRAAVLAGGSARGRGYRRSAFQGGRIGRGAGIGRLLAQRDRWASYRQRRVVIKTRLVRLAGKSLKAAQLHLRYIQRDGVTRECLPGELYDAAQDRADGKAFLDRSHGDRHQFRFIVAAEDAAAYDDLKDFTRRLMRQMEKDLGTRLDWVAVDHFNTGHPHTHVVLRGHDEQGQDLVIARDYIARGLRERAQEIVTLDLGPRTDLEIEDRLRQEVEQERFTSLDRALLRDAGEKREVSIGIPLGSDHARFRQTLQAGRLQMLQRLGLAEETRPGRWRLHPELEPTLRRMGERGDIIKAMHQVMRETGVVRAARDYAIYDPAAAQAKSVIGRVLRLGISDEINDRHFMIVDGVDGRAHYVALGRRNSTEPMAERCIVAVAGKPTGARPADRTVAEIAAIHDGRYSAEIHRQHDPGAGADFIQSHIRRLEAIRRATGAVSRETDGTWSIPADHLEQAASYEAQRTTDSPVKVTTLSHLPLDRLVGAQAATWLDRTLIDEAAASCADRGFGREVQEAQQRRRQWLIAQDLADAQQGRIVYRAGLLSVLRRRELIRMASQLSDELGLPYAAAEAGQRIAGRYQRRLDLVSGRFALIANSREFTLVPWRPTMEAGLGRQISGHLRGDTFTWTPSRSRTPGLS